MNKIHSKHRHSCPVLIALLVLSLPLACTLHAQNTSPLDTAPGAPTATMANTNSAAATPPAAPLTPDTTSADSGPSLLSNDNFEEASKSGDWPKDWGHPAPGMTWQSDNGTHYLELVQQQPGKMLMAYREMPIPPGVTGLTITIRYRTSGVVHGKANYMDARSIGHYMDSNRKPVRGDPPVIDFNGPPGVWAEKSVTTVVPPGATKLVLMPALFMANAGTLDLADVRVTALDSTAVATLTVAAAARDKQNSDRQAVLAQVEAMPAKTQMLHASGNQLVTPDGKPVWLQGVNVPQLAWSPNGEGRVPWSVYVATHDWHANVIRLPVMDSLWFGQGHGDEGPNNPDVYRTVVDQAIKVAGAEGAYVVLDLHRFLTPDASCVTFWKDAAARYKNNPTVLFDLFNEPHDTSWDVWQKGGPVQVKQANGSMATVQGVGMQALIDAVRGTGAKNVVVCGGLGYAYDLTGVLNGYALDDKGGNGIMYATHFYNWHKGWTKHFMAVAAKYPVLIGETGADVKKMNFIPANQQEDPSTWVPDLIGFIQKNHLNWTAWSFSTGATPAMLSNMDDDTPNTFWGEPVKEALGGKQFTMKSER